MNQQILSFVVFSLLLSIIGAIAFNETDEVTNFEWGTIEYRQGGESIASFEGLEAPFEVQATLSVEEIAQNVPNGIGIYLPAKYTISWDGEVLRPMWDKESLYQVYSLPHDFGEGEHTLQLKIESFEKIKADQYQNLFDTDYTLVSIDSVERLMRNDLVRTSFIHILAGVFFAIGLYYALLYWFNKKACRFITFSALCFSFFILIIAEYYLFHQLYHYSSHGVRLGVVQVFSMLSAFLLPIFFHFRFHVLPKVYWLVGLLPFQLAFIFLIDGFDAQNQVIILSGVIVSLAMVLFALSKNATGGREALYGILIWLAAYLLIENYDLNLFLGFGMLIFFNLLSLSIQLRKQRSEYEQSLVRSSRLELELLKKNIQPHFLMNSLSSAVAWLQQNPKKGIDLIIALSEELQQLIDVSALKMIPLEKEIELCRSFMKVMSFRKEIHYHLSVEGDISDVHIPPAILLTLIENGITHGDSNSSKSKFRLEIHRIDDETYLVLSVPLGEVVEASEIREGTGTQYIKARLQESFNTQWDYSYRVEQNEWKTTIKYARN